LNGAGVYKKPEDRPDEDRLDDDEEKVGDDGNQGSGDESDDNQYKVPRGMKGDKTALLARGIYGSITEKERGDLLLKVSHCIFYNTVESGVPLIAPYACFQSFYCLTGVMYFDPDAQEGIVCS
jgi:hypothetical protein